MIEFLYLTASFLIGIMVGLTGVGGGSLLTPTLIIFFGIPPVVAVGTDLVVVFVTKFFGTLNYFYHRAFSSTIVLYLLAGSIPSSLLTLRWLKHYPLDQHDDLVGWVLLVVVVITLLITLMRPVIAQWQSAKSKPDAGLLGVSSRYRNCVLIGAGALLGFLVSISSVGGGVLGLAIIGLLYPTLPIRLLVGSDLLHTLFLTMIAGAGHLFEGRFDYGLFLLLISGSIPGVILGGIWMNRVSDKLAKRLVVGVLSLVVLMLFWYKFV